MSEPEDYESLGSASESSDGDYSDDGDFHPNSEASIDEEEANEHVEKMADLRKALELMKAHFEKCATPKAHLYLAMIDAGADALDDQYCDYTEYDF